MNVYALVCVRACVRVYGVNIHLKLLINHIKFTSVIEMSNHKIVNDCIRMGKAMTLNVNK